MSKGKSIVSWIIQILIAVMFLMMGGQKLMGEAEVTANFARWGFPSFMQYIIGFFEVAGAIGLLIPRLAGLAASGLILIMMGALGTHLMHGEFDMAPVPVAVSLLLGIVAYVRSPLAIFGNRKESAA
ncbi:MAG: DoxX family protein [Pyrinomonadaceae bacterium]